MTKPGPTKNKPPSALVDRIVREEAKKFGVTALEVLCGSNKPVARAARTAAMDRIIDATGCSHGGLEQVWGGKLRRLHRRYRQPERGVDMHAFRLTWLYGGERAAAIIQGRDPATERDRKAWRQIGGVRA